MSGFYLLYIMKVRESGELVTISLLKRHCSLLHKLLSPFLHYDKHSKQKSGALGHLGHRTRFVESPMLQTELLQLGHCLECFFILF